MGASAELAAFDNAKLHLCFDGIESWRSGALSSFSPNTLLPLLSLGLVIPSGRVSCREL